MEWTCAVSPTPINEKEIVLLNLCFSIIDMSNDRKRQLSNVPKYNYYDNDGDNAKTSATAGTEKNPSILDNAEVRVKNFLTTSETIIWSSPRSNDAPGDEVDTEHPFSDFHAPTEVLRFAAQVFNVEEAELVKKNWIDCGSMMEFLYKIKCCISNPEEYKAIPIMEAQLKKLKTERAKLTARKNSASGKCNTKHKSQLIKILAPFSPNEGKLSTNVTDRSNYHPIDVMNNLRRIKWKDNVKTFKNLAENFCNNVTSCKNANRIDFVFDVYREFSPKSAKRLERYGTGECIEFPIADDESLPIDQKNQFWAYEKNKIKVQKYLRNYIAKNFDNYWKNAVVVLSDTNEEQCQVFRSHSSDSSSENDYCKLLRRPDIDEADDRIMVHIDHALTYGYDNVCILSQDTDVFVGALYFYWNSFKKNGLKGLWMAIAVGPDKFRPIHEFAERLGPELCAVLPALHNLTGADCTDKVGSKGGGLQANPVKYLSGFAHGTSEDEVNISVQRAEEYLVQVVRKGNVAKTFDELSNSPFTSAFVKQNILRALYITHNCINILDANYNSLDPQSFGYRQETNGSLMPIKPDNEKEDIETEQKN